MDYMFNQPFNQSVLNRVSLPLLVALVAVPSVVRAESAMLDLRRAVVLTPKDLGRVEQKAISMLLDEVEVRTQIRLNRADAWPEAAAPVIVVGQTNSLRRFADARKVSLAGGGPAEGYRLFIDNSGPAPAV